MGYILICYTSIILKIKRNFTENFIFSSGNNSWRKQLKTHRLINTIFSVDGSYMAADRRIVIKERKKMLSV